MDCWDPNSFRNEVTEMLTANSELIKDYFVQECAIMDEYIGNNRANPLKSNSYHSDFNWLLEHELMPLIGQQSIRLWHYTRLINNEVEAMCRQLELSNVNSLKTRLDNLVKRGHLTKEEADLILHDTVLMEQEAGRAERILAVAVPLPVSDCGVKPLLESWGGEAASFSLSSKELKNKLKSIGIPRVVEIETVPQNCSQQLRVSEICLQAWARNLGVKIDVENCDYVIKGSLEQTRVLRVHSMGSEMFDRLACTYPKGCGSMLKPLRKYL